MVTITDIARRLGVAVSTVSKGLNGANDVSESTRALILKTAVEMGYARPKRLASRFGALSGASVLSRSFGYFFAPP